MKIKVTTENIKNLKGEAIIAGIFEGSKTLSGIAADIDKSSNGIIKNIIKNYRDFSGELNQISVLYPRNGIPIKRVVLVGLGKRSELDTEKLKGTISRAACHARDMGVKDLLIPTSFVNTGELVEDKKAGLFIEAILLGLAHCHLHRPVSRPSLRQPSRIHQAKTGKTM